MKTAPAMPMGRRRHPADGGAVSTMTGPQPGDALADAGRQEPDAVCHRQLLPWSPSTRCERRAPRTSSRATWGRGTMRDSNALCQQVAQDALLDLCVVASSPVSNDAVAGNHIEDEALARLDPHTKVQEWLVGHRMDLGG
jgi:hypothetical protein